MKLECVYVRFFRSFNFDYERKAHPEAKQQGWEQTEQGWYPFIHLDIDPQITAVVGANESGKSHLLDAVQKLLTDERVDRQDFCRYSDLYSVEQGGRRVSDFAGKFRTETDEDRALMAALGYSGGEELFYVRSGNGSSFVFTNDAPEQCPLTSDHETALRASFSQVFRLETEVALPASMTIRRLADQATDRFPDRAGRRHILDSLPDYNVSESEVSRWWPAVRDYVRPISGAAGTAGISDTEFDLGRRLLIDVARIDPASFRDLDEALAAEREGEVNALIQKMNDAIARHLNFPKWWAQDRDFRLLLAPRARSRLHGS